MIKSDFVVLAIDDEIGVRIPQKMLYCLERFYFLWVYTESDGVILYLMQLLFNYNVKLRL